MSQFCAFLSAMWLCAALQWGDNGNRVAMWVGLAACAFMGFASWAGR